MNSGNRATTHPSQNDPEGGYGSPTPEDEMPQRAAAAPGSPDPAVGGQKSDEQSLSEDETLGAPNRNSFRNDDASSDGEAGAGDRAAPTISSAKNSQGTRGLTRAMTPRGRRHRRMCPGMKAMLAQPEGKANRSLLNPMSKRPETRCPTNGASKRPPLACMRGRLRFRV